MGTIEKDLPWREDGDVVYGPGIHDMKGSAYLSYRAFRHLAETGERTPLPIRFLYSSDEEVGSPTSRDLIEEAGRNAKYVLVTEPARDGGKIVVQRKGTARFKLRTRGRPSHAGAYHQDGRSAILEMARQIIAIEALTDYDAGLTVNIGTVSGGTRPNVVPEHCVVEIDMRMPSLAVGQAAIAKLEAMTPHDPDVTLTLEGEIDRPPMERSEGVEKLFQHARKCAADLGIALEGVYTGGGSDGNFTAALGIPTLDGLGADGRGAHTMEEQIYKSSLVPRTELMLSLFRTLT